MLKEHHVWAFKVAGGPYQQAGVPDIVGCLGGKFFAIEVKVPGNKPTPLQEKVMQDIENAGGAVSVAYSVDDVRKYLDLE